jgi:hypothetical protein
MNSFPGYGVPKIDFRLALPEKPAGMNVRSAVVRVAGIPRATTWPEIVTRLSRRRTAAERRGQKAQPKAA